MFFYFSLVISYILGSIPFGKIIGFKKGIDIQKRGSGNIGFANSLRTLGWKPALIVLAADVLKGFIPTYFALHQFDLAHTFLIGLVSIMGHIFSPWLKFKGGKGVATMVGVSLGLNPLLTSIGVAAWIIIFLWNKTASVSSLILTLLMPLLALFFDFKLLYFYLLLAVIIFLTHKPNIINLVKGKETKTI
jgi:glycerol-3-phosphate acyltransferase PlsY